MDFVILIGRVLFGAVFLAAALGHLSQTSSMAQYAESRGVPNAPLVVRLSGVVIALGAASVMLGVFADLGALILAAFLLTTAFVIHRFWAEPEGDGRVASQTQFMKDLALAGGALMMFGLLASSSDSLGLALTGPVF